MKAGTALSAGVLHCWPAMATVRLTASSMAAGVTGMEGLLVS